MTSDAATGPLLLGIDVGTESARAALSDAHGTLLAQAATPYPTDHPQSGWAEQDPLAWWSAIAESCRQCLKDSGVDARRIVGLSAAATTMTLVATDQAGAPLRPALMWMDVRAVQAAARAQDSQSGARRYNGGGTDPASAEWFPFKAAWLAEHEPHVFDAAHYLFDAPDWLTFKLTGEATQNINTAAHRKYYDADHGGWPRDFYRDVGAAGALDKVPGTVVELGAKVGTLRPDAAEHLGLPAGIAVAQGCGDAWAGQVGLNVLRPGQLALITGSSHVLSGQSEHPISGPGFFGAFTGGVVPGQYTVEGGQSSTGSVLAWFVNHFAGEAKETARAQGISAYDVLNRESEDLPPGAQGLIVNEYFQGNRTPYVDGNARGVLWGLSLNHRPAHVYRAIQEAVCHGTELIIRSMRDAGYRPSEIVACGGATQSRQWMQMHADVTGLPIQLPKVGDAVVLGSCVLAATGAGLSGSVAQAADAMVHHGDLITPDEQRHEQYAFFTDLYAQTYAVLRESMHRMAQRTAEITQEHHG